jgi:lipopolysaccharide export system permease protein
MSGISLSRLMLPALLLGLVGAAITYALDDFVVPYAKTQIELLKQQAIQQASLPYGRKSFSFQTFDDNHRLEQMIYVSRYNGSLLKDTTVVDLTRPGVLQIIQAKTGTWSPANWEFHNANAYTIGKNNSTLVFNHLNTMQVMNMLNTAPKAKQESVTEQMKNPLYVDSANQNFAQMYQGIQNRAAAGVKVGTATVIRLWEKLTLPLSCFFMILTAVPLAIVPPRKGSQRGFLFALAVLFLYYMLRSVFVALGKSSIMSLGGLLPTPTALMLAAWMPLICIAALGVGLMYRKSRVL